MRSAVETQAVETNEAVYFDIDTILLLRETLEDAWGCRRPEQRANMSKTLLAERILKAAAEGERDPERLIDAVLMAVAA
jgi:hypothetical protein